MYVWKLKRHATYLKCFKVKHYLLFNVNSCSTTNKRHAQWFRCPSNSNQLHLCQWQAHYIFGFPKGAVVHHILNRFLISNLLLLCMAQQLASKYERYGFQMIWETRINQKLKQIMLNRWANYPQLVKIKLCFQWEA